MDEDEDQIGKLAQKEKLARFGPLLQIYNLTDGDLTKSDYYLQTSFEMVMMIMWMKSEVHAYQNRRTKARKTIQETQSAGNGTQVGQPLRRP